MEKEFDKYLQKRFDEQINIKKEMDALKNVLVKEVEEKHYWKEKTDKAVKKEQDGYEKLIDYIIPKVVVWTVDRLQNDFILIHKSSTSTLSSALLQAKLSQLAISKDTQTEKP